MAIEQEPDVQPGAVPDHSPAAHLPSFGAWVRQQRRVLDMTQDALARRVGYARVTIKKIEADELRPSRQLAERLAEYFGVSAQEQQAFVQFARRGLAPERPVIVTGALAAPWRSSLRRTGNLPAQVTSFVGREHELAEIRRLVARNRLLTLTGSGGIGKTRLALQAAAAEMDTFGDGVWLVELATLGDPWLVPHAVATALGLREESGEPIAATLTEFLREKQLLLVLDNCEHVVDACAHLAENLLRSSAHLHLLATSREVLGVAGESTYQVPALSVPPGTATAEEIARFEAVRLFAERARASRPAFEITAQSAAAIVQICRQLDGIPLALELAAARLNILSVEQIAERVEDRFRLLTSGSRTALPRHQTLRALIDWSYDLLAEPERLLFQRLSVFVDGFTLEAAESVTQAHTEGATLPPHPSTEILNLLSHLSDKSLILAKQGASESRYTMLETIRQYAHEKLMASNEAEAMHFRHLSYFLSWGESIRRELEGPDQAMGFDRLEIEHNNLLNAIEWAFASGQIEMGLRVAVALTIFWDTRGYLSEGRRLLEVGLSRTANVSEGTRAWALYAAGTLARFQGDHGHAESLLEAGLAIFRKCDDRPGIAASLNIMGLVAVGEGQHELAQRYVEESLAIGRQLGDRRCVAYSLDFLGHAARNLGDYDRARLLYEQSLKHFQELGDKRQIAFLLTSMGNLAMRLGDGKAWHQLTEQSLALRQELNDRSGIAVCLSVLGRIAHHDGDYDLAEAYARQSLALDKALGRRNGMVMNLILMGAIAKDRAVAGRQASGRRRDSASPRQSQAASEAQQLRAARLFAAAEPLQHMIPEDHRAFYQGMLAELREQYFKLTPKTLARAWAEGRAMGLEQAVAYALEETRA